MPTNQPFEHQPVMVEEIVDLFGPVPAGPVVDATLGGAGHARALLEAHPDLSILGLDRDPVAIAVAAERLAPYGARAAVVHARFDAITDAVHARGLDVVSGVLFDLGVSSPQLDDATRGFSHRLDAPLDMRMDPTTGISAADVVNGYSEADLARVLRELGDERYATRIARSIVAHRPTPRRASWPTSCATPSRPPPAVAGVIRPGGRSRPCASR